MVIFAVTHMTHIPIRLLGENRYCFKQPFLRIACPLRKRILNKLSVWSISKILMLYHCFKNSIEHTE